MTLRVMIFSSTASSCRRDGVVHRKAAPSYDRVGQSHLPWSLSANSSLRTLQQFSSKVKPSKSTRIFTMSQPRVQSPSASSVTPSKFSLLSSQHITPSTSQSVPRILPRNTRSRAGTQLNLLPTSPQPILSKLKKRIWNFLASWSSERGRCLLAGSIRGAEGDVTLC
jgi:hypothetical protein